MLLVIQYIGLFLLILTIFPIVLLVQLIWFPGVIILRICRAKIKIFNVKFNSSPKIFDPLWGLWAFAIMGIYFIQCQRYKKTIDKSEVI